MVSGKCIFGSFWVNVYIEKSDSLTKKDDPQCNAFMAAENETITKLNCIYIYIIL